MLNYGPSRPGEPVSPGAGGQYPPAGGPFPGQPGAAPYPGSAQPPPAQPPPDPWQQPSPESPASQFGGQPPGYDPYRNPQQPAFQPGHATPPPPGGYQQQPGYQPQSGYQPQEWAPQGQQPEFNAGWQVPPEKGRSTTVVVMSVILVLVVLAAAGVGFYLYHQSKNTTATAPPPPATVGQCVTQVPQSANSALVKHDCGPGALQVLKIQIGTTDTSICNGVAGATNNYKFDWPVGTASDYVLCLKQQ